MSILKVKKSGLYTSEYGEKEIKVHSYIPYLNNVIKLDDDIIFEDFFKYIMKDTKNYSMVFSSHLGHFPLYKWSKEWRSIAEPTTDLDYIYVHWKAEYTDWSKRVGKHSFAGFDWEITDTHKEIDITVDFSGRGKMKKSDLGDDPSDELIEVAYAIEMTPLNKLKNLPFKLDENFQLFELNDSRTLAEGIKNFTVYEVIGAVLFEISFSGPPDERDAELKKIEEAYNEAEKLSEYKFGNDKEEE